MSKARYLGNNRKLFQQGDLILEKTVLEYKGKLE